MQENLTTHACLTAQQNYAVSFSRKMMTYLKKQHGDKKQVKNLLALFTGINNVTVGQCIEDLDLIAQATEPEEWANLVIYLPLK